jgi:hypothetical protein
MHVVRVVLRRRIQRNANALGYRLGSFQVVRIGKAVKTIVLTNIITQWRPAFLPSNDSKLEVCAAQLLTQNIAAM